ncbi:MAG TPA: hypothetical protein VHV31_09865 [Nitrolancea sp.]|jgi:hypothetical protein|nr:hypothetical protein [Nitrolancea sp.]
MNEPPPEQDEPEPESTIDPAAVRAARAGYLRIALLFLLPLGLMLMASIVLLALILAR